MQVDPDASKAVDDTRISDQLDSTPHSTYLKLSFICSILYFTIITTTKISILLLYLRIFSVNASFRLQARIVGMVVVAFWLAATIATLTICRPLEATWTFSIRGSCFNYNIFWMVTGALEVVIDTAILTLPVRLVLGLQLSRNQKVSVLFVFLLGVLYVFFPVLFQALVVSNPNDLSVWLLQVSFAPSTATSPVAGCPLTPRLSFGVLFTSVWV